MATTWNKPSGIPVFPPHSDPTGDCVLARLLAAQPHRAALDWPDGFDGGIAHRLDIHTSGALLVADDPAELAVIRDAFARKRLLKTYLLHSDRPVPWDRNTCELAIGHAPRRRKGRMVVQRGANTPHRGRWYPARTEFERVGQGLWRARMRTGVMHQIRVHAAFVGIALSGDKLYGGGGDGRFLLHHVGLEGEGIATEPVDAPGWSET